MVSSISGQQSVPYVIHHYLYTVLVTHCLQVIVAKRKKELETVMEKLCEVCRLSTSQIKKYLFPIQVNPVNQILGTPPIKGILLTVL